MTDTELPQTTFTFEEIEMITAAVVMTTERIIKASQESKAKGGQTFYAWKAAKYSTLSGKLAKDLKALIEAQSPADDAK